MPALARPAPALDLPPAYRLVQLREAADAFAHACAIAEREGAGTFVWARRFDLLDVAVVLEPEEPLRVARRVFLVAMAALADGLGAQAMPEKAVSIVWPDTLLYDGARIGGGRLGAPDRCGEDEVPEWLVFGAMLIASKHGAGDPGLTPDSTSLEDEGFETDGAERIAESFARHLMVGFDILAEDGFEAAAQRYVGRLPRSAGERPGVDATGDLLVHAQSGQAGRRALAPALRTPAWLDPATGGVRL